MKNILCGLFISVVLTINPLTAEPLQGADRQAIIQKVETYLNSIKTVKAKIRQINPDGKEVLGEFYLKRPGHMKVQYFGPKPLLLIADESNVTLDEDGQINQVYTDTTPAIFLIRGQIQFEKDLKVQFVDRIDGFLAVGISQPNNENSGLTLMFTESPTLSLVGWTVIDGSGAIIPVKLENIQRDIPIDNKVFRWGK